MQCNRGFLLSAAVGGLSVVVLTATAGWGASNSDADYTELARLNPGSTVAQMKTAVAEESAQSGTPVATVLDEALKEARANATALGVGVQKSPKPTVNSLTSSGGGDKNKKLPNSATGDIFWWDSTTDHVGLYKNSTTVVQAPGVGKVVTVSEATKVDAPTHTELMYVTTKDNGSTAVSIAQMQGAGSWAASKKGAPYNTNFAVNKHVEDDKYNCSQLVWAAWKAAGGSIDLDGNGGTGVYPGDIRDSARTRTFKTSI